MANCLRERARVLVLAHHFPPIGGVVGRNVATARYLPKFGYDAMVVTGPGESAGRWAPRDAELLERVVHVPIKRLPGPVPAPREGVRARVARWTERRPPWVDWWVRGAISAARELEGEFDVVLANLIPYETAEAASVIAAELGVPWVADLEDPWALDEMRVHPTALNHWIDSRHMRRALDSAAALIMSCPEAAERVRREIPEWGDKIVTSIAHGFNADDYSGPDPKRSGSSFRIVHTGALHTELGRDHRRTRPLRRLLGGTSLDVDILTRSHAYLIEALHRVAAARPELAERVELNFVGRLTPVDREVASRHPRVQEHGQLPHGETIALARSADLLFLPTHDLPPGARAGIVPCKTYEYLATGHPILAAVCDGDARDLLERFARASICRPSDVDGMAAAIVAAIEDSDSGDAQDSAPTLAETELLARYERRHLTGEIAAVLDDARGMARTPLAGSAASHGRPLHLASAG